MKTVDEVRTDFRRRGVPIARWAKDHGFNVYTVYRVLDGSIEGRYGKSHKIAIALGLKEGAANEDTAPRLKRRGLPSR